jgi:hypothetical protein
MPITNQEDDISVGILPSASFIPPPSLFLFVYIYSLLLPFLFSVVHAAGASIDGGTSLGLS